MPSRYDPYATHHTSRRLDGWDYTQAALYFVTVCTHQRAHVFGTVRDRRMVLTAVGRIVAEEWHRSETIRDEVVLDAFVVMPNHIHGIVGFTPDAPGATDDSGTPPDSTERPDAREPAESNEASHGRATLCGGGDPSHDETNASDDTPALYRPPRSLGSFVAGFKSAATRRINQHRGTLGASVWQRNYHDRIIRNERHLHAARRYIRDNPANWHEDRARRDG